MLQEVQQLNFDFHAEKAEIVAEPEEIKLKIGEFAGPLDLLLFLIKQEKANIFDIPIAKITDEYLRYIRFMNELDIKVASEFLVMAATLIEIKSRMLLPQVASIQEDEEAEDPRRQLVQQLLEYEKFKNAAQMLWEKAAVESSIFKRGKTEFDEDSLINITVFDVLSAFRRILQRYEQKTSMEIEREEISLTNMIKRLKKELSQMGKLSLEKIAGQFQTKKALITAILAILEIVRTEKVLMIQEKPFGDILLLSKNFRRS
jgi:segregation and condensation protein A